MNCKKVSAPKKALSFASLGTSEPPALTYFKINFFKATKNAFPNKIYP